MPQLPNEMLLEQINNGLILMVLGMGVVFVFLTLLVFSTKFFSFIIRKYLPESAKPIVRPSSVSAAAPAASNPAGAEIAAAIAAAVVRSKR